MNGFGKNLDPKRKVPDMIEYWNLYLNDEMVTLSYANLLYEANTTAFKTSRQMFQNTLELLK